MDSLNITQFILSFVFVIGLILGIAWIVKRFGLERRLIPKARPDARLEIVDQLLIDPRRRVVLIRRDKKEHLVLLSADRELLIETYDKE
jgi:flagellar protein FliO/FliZ